MVRGGAQGAFIVGICRIIPNGYHMTNEATTRNRTNCWWIPCAATLPKVRLRRHHLWISFSFVAIFKNFLTKKLFFVFIFPVSLCSAIASRNERFLRLRRFIIITPRFPCTWIKQNNKTDIIETTDVRISFFRQFDSKRKNQSFNQTKEMKLSWTVHDWFLEGKIARRSLATMDETTFFAPSPLNFWWKVQL